MKKHHLWGRKRPGPYTRLGNQIFDAPGKVFDTASDVAGMAFEGATAAGGAAWDAGSKINEWGQEHTKMDLEDHGGAPWWEN